MGNSTSSSGRGPQDDTVDYGSLHPQGVYSGQSDWNQNIVARLIVERKLAPFYRPLEDYEESWDDEQILAARKALPEADPSVAPEGSTPHPPRLESSGSSFRHKQRPSITKEAHPARTPTAAVYKSSVECPICFLYYPPNINHSRCCDQAICTECFVQIKRNEPTTTHLSSEPAACPYCVQDNFGVVYTPPVWRAGIGSEGNSPLWTDSPKGSQQSIETSAPIPTHKRRQKSFGADAPEVVTTDQIRPDWEAKVNAVRAAVARRANRRIIMRQVGDRLIPVGVTSGRVHPLSEEGGNGDGTNGEGRRSRRNRNNRQEEGQFMGINGQDLDDLMMMEAMRLSLLDHEEQQRKQAAEKEKEDQNKARLQSAPTAAEEPSILAAYTSSAPPTGLSPAEISTRHLSSSSSRRSSPPTFSTIAADIAPVATASAVLLGERASPAEATSTTRVSSPVPTVIDTVPEPNVGAVDTPAESSRPVQQHMDSFTSSIMSNGDDETPYNFLPSDDESIADARLPLLRTETDEIGTSTVSMAGPSSEADCSGQPEAARS